MWHCVKEHASLFPSPPPPSPHYVASTVLVHAPCPRQSLASPRAPPSRSPPHKHPHWRPPLVCPCSLHCSPPTSTLSPSPPTCTVGGLPWPPFFKIYPTFQRPLTLCSLASLNPPWVNGFLGPPNTSHGLRHSPHLASPVHLKSLLNTSSSGLSCASQISFKYFLLWLPQLFARLYMVLYILWKLMKF